MEAKVSSARFSERLNEALKIKVISAADLSEKTGISSGTISRYRTGSQTARASAVKKIAQALEVSPGWLIGLDDEEEKKKAEALETIVGTASQALKPLSQTEQGLVDMFREMTFSDQLKVLNFANDLKSNSEEIK